MAGVVTIDSHWATPLCWPVLTVRNVFDGSPFVWASARLKIGQIDRVLREDRHIGEVDGRRSRLTGGEVDRDHHHECKSKIAENDREIVAADIRLGGRKAKLGVRVPHAISIKYDLETQGAETARWMFNSLKIFFCAAVACELHHIRFQIHE